MSIVHAMAWSQASHNVPGPQPTAAVQRRIVASLERRLRLDALRPLALSAASWRRPEHIARPADNDFLACLSLTCEPGSFEGSLRRWIQWQHPLWVWSPAPFPEALAIAAVAAGEERAGEKP